MTRDDDPTPVFMLSQTTNRGVVRGLWAQGVTHYGAGAPYSTVRFDRLTGPSAVWDQWCYDLDNRRNEMILLVGDKRFIYPRVAHIGLTIGSVLSGFVVIEAIEFHVRPEPLSGYWAPPHPISVRFCSIWSWSLEAPSLFVSVPVPVWYT